MPSALIVVGVDFSDSSRRALDHAAAVARRRRAPVTLLHVATLPDPRWERLFADSLAESARQLAAIERELRGQGLDVDHLQVDGLPDVAIADAVRKLGAALVVVGTHGRSGFQRLLLGSVAEKTVRLATTSVLVARGDAPPHGYRRIVVGTDLSAACRAAVDQALLLAAPDAEVRVVHAWEAPYLSAEAPAVYADELRRAAETGAAALRAQLEDPRVRVEVVHGAPARALCERSTSADLVVVASHGRRGLRHLLLGSVAEATVRHARCAVLVAR